MRVCAIRYPLSAILALTTTLIGCQQVQPPPPPPVAQLQPEPTADVLVVERDWPVSASVVPSGVTVAYSTRYVYEPMPDAPPIRRVWQEPVLFAVDTVLFPLTYLRTPPFTWREYPGLEIPASYTAQPLLPPTPDGAVLTDADEAVYPSDAPPDPRASDTPGLPEFQVLEPSD